MCCFSDVHIHSIMNQVHSCAVLMSPGVCLLAASAETEVASIYNFSKIALLLSVDKQLKPQHPFLCVIRFGLAKSVVVVSWILAALNKRLNLQNLVKVCRAANFRTFPAVPSFFSYINGRFLLFLLLRLYSLLPIITKL